MLLSPENIPDKPVLARYLPARLPKYPVRAEFSAITRNLLNETSAILLTARTHSAFALPVQQKCLQNHPHLNWYLRKLRHPLSPRAQARTAIDLPDSERAEHATAIDKRTLVERLAAAQFGVQLMASLKNTNAHDFTDCLEKIASRITNLSMRIRTKPATIQPDNKGVGWICLAPNDISAALQELHRYLLLHRAASPLLTAIVAMVMLSAIHPFADANGRLSRVVFHAILHDHVTSPKLYFPFKQIFRMSDCGFEIRLRLVFLKDDWQSIIQYLCRAIQLFVAASQNQLKSQHWRGF